MAIRFSPEQMGAVQRQQIEAKAGTYASALRRNGVPLPDMWTDSALLADTVAQLEIAMVEFGLNAPDDLYRYLALRHRVGPRLHALGRVRRHFAGDDAPDGARVLGLLAAIPAGYWVRIRGQAGYEGPIEPLPD